MRSFRPMPFQDKAFQPYPFAGNRFATVLIQVIFVLATKPSASDSSNLSSDYQISYFGIYPRIQTLENLYVLCSYIFVDYTVTLDYVVLFVNKRLQNYREVMGNL